MKALIIDRYFIKTEILKEILKGEGIEVDIAFNAIEGMKLLKRNSYSCAFFEYNLPDYKADLLIENCITELENTKLFLNTSDYTAIKNHKQIGFCDAVEIISFKTIKSLLKKHELIQS